MKYLVIIPTYNEKENIEKVIKKVFEQATFFHILVVDDASKDGTAQIVKRLCGEFPDRLFIYERSGKLGLGTAYIAGFKWGLQKNYDYMFEMDADFSHNPQDLDRLLAACKEYPYLMSVGSRYVAGGNVKNWDKTRILISKLGSLYTRCITFMPLKDTTAGFICYNKRVLEAIDLDAIHLAGYGFQIEMKFKAIKKGFKIKEVPITFVDRVEGVSKMNSKIILEAMWGVLKMQILYVFRILKV